MKFNGSPYFSGHWFLPGNTVERHDQRVPVRESSDGPKGRLNYPDGFVSKDGQWFHFACDDNRHRAGVCSAKLPPKR